MSTQPDSGVVITSKDMYLEIIDLKGQVGRLVPPAEQLADHEKRLRKLERLIWAFPSSVVLATAAVVVAYLQAHSK